MQSAHVVLASRNPDGQEIVTYQLRYWRAIHSELMTHRVFSRNASSSRAIPVMKTIAQVWHDPAGPIHWGTNKPGMQAGDELSGWRLATAKFLWKFFGRVACCMAWTFAKIGLHKQVANRVLEPWQYISVVLTATEFDNWRALRIHPKAMPEIHNLAVLMENARSKTEFQQLYWGEWHIPYIRSADGVCTLAQMLKISVARCARTSYNNHDGSKNTYDENAKLHDDLITSRPAHASPAEHQAMAVPGAHANLRGFQSYRTSLESQGRM